MAKLDHVQQKKLNPADELRDMLDSLAERQANIKSMTQADVLTLFQDLDAAQDLFAQLEAAGTDMLPEQGRFDSVLAKMHRSSRRLLKIVGGPAALTEHRPVPAPDHVERWWWYVDEVVVIWRNRFFKRMAITVGAIIAIIGAIVLAFNTILAPSPEAIARVEAESDAFNALSQLDYEGALAELEQGLAVVPGDTELLTIQGITHELFGEPNLANQSFEQAKANANDPVFFHLGRGQIYLRTNQNEKAEEDARIAIELNDEMSMAWLLLGQSLEAQGKEFEAIPAYQQAGDLAMENGDNEVVVLARMAMGRIGGLTP